MPPADEEVDGTIPLKLLFFYGCNELSPKALMEQDPCHAALYFLDREQAIDLQVDDYTATTFGPTLKRLCRRRNMKRGLSR